ncbi:helix-turn-helix transcriptional regulator [Caballeronia sp. LZ032]|uniref:helix-turn-helix transcriptional regulator n=1 Tax=Caballeronia sp. LZ032 TaxID=3038565 RepID=UPI00285B4D83|nr:helix-turn-helix transcriptional regulator [Caballeronia sp. LZ032]MDR5880267.1 helix-turn-helix transcriptional regulator [Caballeronia sp. LZ032]
MESFRAIGERLKLHRQQMKMTADEVAEAIGVSRALLHRYEAGNIVKLETLERLARVYGMSPSTLLGLGAEYLTDGFRFFERVASLEEKADRVSVVFGPLIYVLSSAGYDRSLARSLHDPQDLDPLTPAEGKRLLQVLERRKAIFRFRQPAMVNIVPLSSIERYLANGLAVTADKPYAERAELRREAAREIGHMADLIASPPMHVQIGLTTQPLPTSGYQIIHAEGRRYLVNSPFRIGQPTNLRYGVGTITEDPEALAKHDHLTGTLWQSALKGAQAMHELHRLIKKYSD